MVIPLFTVRYMDSKLNGPLWYARKMPEGEQLILDFQNIEFVRPECVILLIAVSKMLFDRTKLPIYWRSLSVTAATYLSNINISQIDFIDVEQPPTKRFAPKFSQDFSLKLLPLQKIQSPSELSRLTQQTEEILRRWFPERTDSGFYSTASTAIMEIVGNSMEHSVSNYSPDNTGTCYVTIQRYQSSGSNKVIIAFGDVGIGVKASLRQRNEWIVADSYGIKKILLEGGITSRESRKGGLGLAAICELLRKNGGSITMRSGKGSVFYRPSDGKRVVKEHKEFLVGTQTAVVL